MLPVYKGSEMNGSLKMVKAINLINWEHARANNLKSVQLEQ
jgi:hypothetical protein